jgi:hypothetical protein
VFGAAGDGARAFFANLLLDVFGGAAGVYVFGLRELRDVTVHVCAGVDELGLALVPGS